MPVVTTPRFIKYDAELSAFTVFMVEAHDKGSQPERKYTGEPYGIHPVAVAEVLYNHGIRGGGIERAMIFAALGHDLFEDTDAKVLDVIRAGAPQEAIAIISACTDPKVVGNRAARKEAFNVQLQNASREAQTVKLADCIHNLSTLPKERGGYHYKYAKEKQDFVRSLDEVHANATAVSENIERVYGSLRRELLSIIDNILD